MDDYASRQLALIKSIEEQFRVGKSPSTIVDAVSDYETDDRICLTALTYLPSKLQKKIYVEIVEPLKKIDNRQYFYESSALHITVQNVRVINNPPHFTKDDIEKARKVFNEVVAKHGPLKVEILRIFELPTSFALSAFTTFEWEELVFDLRSQLKKVGVPDDKSYAPGPVLANTTICRYTTPPNEEFMCKLKKLKEIRIGSFDVKNILLVTTNAVSLPSKTTIIEEYNLG